MYAWLIQNELDEYAEEFIAKKIDGKQLLNLDGSRLKVGFCVLSQSAHDDWMFTAPSMANV